MKRTLCSMGLDHVLRRMLVGGLLPACLLLGPLASGCMDLDGDGGETDSGTATRDGGAGTDGGPSPMDGATAADGATADGGHDPGEATWSIRDCTHTVRYRSPGATEVLLAGDFTSWADDALSMEDGDGDGVFEVVLSPGGSLVPGELHAYKIVVDGSWQLDPGSTHRKYDGECLNSAFRMPTCDAGPEIRVDPITTAYDTTTNTGSASVRVHLSTATDGAAPGTIRFSLGDEDITATASLDAEAGAYDLALADLAPGKHVLHLRASDTEGREAQPVDLPIWIEREAFDWQDTFMYMVVVDRFANGDRTIDAPVGSPVEYPADFHGGDLQGVLEVMRSGYFERLGVRAIWLSPINQQAEGAFGGRDGTHSYAGYHGYWPSRARDVEPRFGGNEALRALVDEAHQRGIRILLDLINNQIHEDHEYYVDHRGWFRTGCVCGIDPECGWSERPLDCLFAPYLPDINWRIPGAEQQFIADAVHWVSEYDVDGFRIDAVKHVETNSIYNLRAELNRRFEQGGERLLLVGETAVGEHDSVDYGCGETYGTGYEWIAAYTGETALDGQFDFPTHHRMQWGLVTGSMGFDTLESIVSDTEAQYSPDALHVQFLGTHDSNRIATRAALDPARDCKWPEGEGCSSLPGDVAGAETFGRIKRALTVLMTLPGIPFLYYGDEVAMAGGNDPDCRRDMVWTGELASLAMGDTELSAEQVSLRSFVEKLGQARAQSAAIRRGERLPLVSEPDLYVYAWWGEGELAVVAVNRGAAVTSRTVFGLSAGAVGSVTSLEAAAGSGTASLSGTELTLSVGAGEAVVFLGR